LDKLRVVKTILPQSNKHSSQSKNSRIESLNH